MLSPPLRDFEEGGGEGWGNCCLYQVSNLRHLYPEFFSALLLRKFRVICIWETVLNLLAAFSTPDSSACFYTDFGVPTACHIYPGKWFSLFENEIVVSICAGLHIFILFNFFSFFFLLFFFWGGGGVFLIISVFIQLKRWLESHLLVI